MTRFPPRDPAYAQRVADAFRHESATARWGAALTAVAPGAVDIALPYDAALSAAPGVLHRGIVAALLDDACLLAALSLTAAGDTAATAEYKLNHLAPAAGESITAAAEVIRPGRTITVCRADARANGRLAARMLATLTISRV